VVFNRLTVREFTTRHASPPPPRARGALCDRPSVRDYADAHAGPYVPADVRAIACPDDGEAHVAVAHDGEAHVAVAYDGEAHVRVAYERESDDVGADLAGSNYRLAHGAHE